MTYNNIYIFKVCYILYIINCIIHILECLYFLLFILLCRILTFVMKYKYNKWHVLYFNCFVH